MWYGMCRFSLEPLKNIYGPFETENDAWNYIEMCADNEYKDDIEEYNCESHVAKNKQFGEITIKTRFSSGKVGTSLYCIFEIDNL